MLYLHTNCCDSSRFSNESRIYRSHKSSVISDVIRHDLDRVSDPQTRRARVHGDTHIVRGVNRCSICSQNQMAEWKARGYVPDSDEDDDSQNSLPNDPAAPSEAFYEIDDILGSDLEKRYQGNEEVGTPGLGRVNKELDDQQNTGNEEKEEGIRRAARTVTQHEKPYRTQALGSRLGLEDEDTSVPDFGDIDELQHDQYQIATAVQIQYTPKNGGVDTTDHPDSSSFNQRPGTLSLSPLSSPPLSPTESSPAQNVHGLNLNSSGVALQDLSSDRENNLAIVKNVDHVRSTRNLRHRNPIQLHPYAIEIEKYRQVCRARGVKPLRIAQMEAEKANLSTEDSQNIEYSAEESQSLDNGENDNDPSSSSPVLSGGSTNAPAGEANDIFVFEGDDLPDTTTLLAQSSHHFARNGYKRRKTSSTSFKKPPHPVSKGQTLPDDNTRLRQDSDSVVLDLPPSPPRSGSRTPPQMALSAVPRFRVPRRPSPTMMPTPITSSEPRKLPFVMLSDEEESNHERRGHTRPSSLSDASNSTSDSASSSADDEKSHQLQRAQRKIRGVLPASWLKIDLKTQNKKFAEKNKSQLSVSPEKKAVQRGVARPVTYARSSLPSPQLLQHKLSFDSESDESVSSDILRLRDLHRQNQNSLDNPQNEEFPSSRWGEAGEDDRIDAMLPTATRSYGPRRKRRKLQTSKRITSYSKPGAQDSPTILHDRRGSQPRITDRLDKCHTRKPLFRPPRLSILDAPTMKEYSYHPMPRFLKVASRTVRSRPDKGRHSPSRKYLRMATKEDSTDTNSTLRRWREGSIAPSADHRATIQPLRRPLHPRSGNNDLPSGTLERETTKKRSDAASSKTAPIKPRLYSAKPRKVQSSLDHVVRRRDIARPDSTDGGRDEASHTILDRDNPKKRRQTVPSVQTCGELRPAILESLPDQDGAAFRRDLSSVNRFNEDSGISGVLLRRFFDVDKRSSIGGADVRNHHSSEFQNTRITKAAKTKPFLRQPRKRRPQRRNLSPSWSGQSAAPVAVDDFPDKVPTYRTHETISENVVIGLEPFGSRYTETFDITPLPVGTCFHEKTILGSGAFASSLKLACSSHFDHSRGFSIVRYKDKVFRWGPWNDTVSSELGEIFDTINLVTQDPLGFNQQEFNYVTLRQVICLQEDVIDYISNHLTFLDPVDRGSYIQRCQTMMTSMLNALDGLNLGDNADHVQQPANLQSTDVIRATTLSLILTNQAYQISEHELISNSTRAKARSLVQKATSQVLALSMNEGYDEFVAFLSQSHQLDGIEYVIGDHLPSIEAFVVAHHVISQFPDWTGNIWDEVVKDFSAKPPSGLFDAHSKEQSWRRLFTLMPYLEFDTQGVLETGRRFKVPLDGWMLIKRLISPVLQISLANPRGQPPSFNFYCRALFGRCLHLINGWGWRRCESIIGTLFDFFARNNLSHLSKEESHGSPIFLECLDKNPVLKAEPQDRCFHILLKIIASGLQHMRQIYPEKKIRDIVWRLMPNHGRSHPKEDGIRQEDLDALRNHHDLLSTLYYASPPGVRPRLTVIRNLVHLETSHREACHINIRAWFNLVKFQLSTEEPMSRLELFSEWHDDLLSQILRQHNLARTEAEDQVRSIQHTGDLQVSRELLESTIARNQRQVEAVLNDALVSLKLSLDVAPNQEAAAVLLSSGVIRVFEALDIRRPQVIKTVIRALVILSTYARKVLTVQQQSGSGNDNDDSQDYGDWSAFGGEEMSSTQPQVDDTMPLRKFQEPLRQLLSNCFGADIAPEDSLLVSVVDVWIYFARLFIRQGAKTWDDYIGRFGNDCWGSLRDTEQCRKYTTYFHAVVIESDSQAYHSHTKLFLTSWIGSLVERESLLRFQHRLTNALLNVDHGNAVFQNLPFWINPSSGQFEITLIDFSERRLSLISCLLSNMRIRVENAMFEPSINTTTLRQEYKDLLKHLMMTMKNNYQQLGNGANVRGAYVDFVHKVIEFLQQHTSTVCPIDRFFTDNGAFPLPSADPTYVVGQLKNYGLRLQDPRTPKQLVVFLQSVSERAAVDGQQPYLAGQFQTAMSRAFEDDLYPKPTLRSFIVRAVVPAYVELAFSAPNSWILALPYLQALEKAFGELLVDLDGSNIHSIAACSSIATAYLASVRKSLTDVVHNPRALKEAAILRTLSMYYAAATALLPVLDYLVRLSGPTHSAVQDIQLLKSFSSFSTSILQGRENVLPPEPTASGGEPPPDPQYTDIRRFATWELRDTLTKHWVSHDGRCYVVRGSSRREVMVDIGLYEEERAHFQDVLGEFLDSVETMPALGSGDCGMLAVRRGRVCEVDGFIF